MTTIQGQFRPERAEFADQPTAAEQREALRQAEAEALAKRPSLGQGVADALGQNTSAFIVQRIQRQFELIRPGGFLWDPSWQLTKDRLVALTQGLPREYWDRFDEATSEREAQLIRVQLLAVAEKRQRLAAQGTRGAVLQIAAEIADPAFIAAGYLAAPILAPTKGARLLERMARGGLFGFASVAPVEAIRSAEDPERDIDDLIHATAAGMIFTGALNSAFGKRLEALATNVQKSAELRTVQTAGGELTPKGQAYFSKQLDPAQAATDTRRMIDALEGAGMLTADQAESLRLAPDHLVIPELRHYRGIRPEYQGPTPTPAAATPERPSLSGTTTAPPTPAASQTAARTFDDPPDLLAVATPSGATGGRVRFDMAGRTKSSEVPTLRRAAHIIASDPLPGPQGEKSILSLGEWSTWFYQRKSVQFYRRAIQPIKDHFEANGTRWHQRRAHRAELMRQATGILRRGAAGESAGPAGVIAEGMRADFADILQQLKRLGVPGFKDVPENATYVPRIVSRVGWDNLTAKLERLRPGLADEAIHSLIKQSLLNGSDNLAPRQADILARVWAKHTRRSGDASDLKKATMFSLDRADDLRATLKAEAPDITDAELDDLIFKLAPGEAGKPTTARALRRLAMDETATVPVMVDGKPVATIALEDLLENNAEYLFSLYAHQAAGAMAENELLRSAAGAGKQPYKSYDALVAAIREEARTMNVNAERDLSRLDTMHRAAIGLPLGANTTTAKVLAAVRSFNVVRVMNLVGFAQAPDLGNVIGEATHGSFIKAMPAYRILLNRARDPKTGRLLDAELDELETLFAAGTDWLRNQGSHRLDIDDATLDLAGGRLNTALHAGQRITTAMSGLGPVDTYLQVKIFDVLKQNFGAAALNAKKARGASLTPTAERLASMNLDAALFNRIVKQVELHGTFEPGPMTGRRLALLNVDAWTDQAAAVALRDSMWKVARRAVQRDDVGGLSEWMTTDLGRTLIQFRGFQLAAWAKQTLHGVKMRDRQVFASWSAQMFFGGLSYVGLTYTQSIGRPDRSEFLKKRLTSEAIAAAAFYRSGFSSLLPGMIDTPLMALGVDPLFQQGRTTGLGTDVLTGIPSVEFGMSAFKAGTAMLDGESFSRQDLKAVQRVLPFQNAIGIMHALNAIGGELPPEE